MLLGTYGYSDFMDRMMGGLTPYSFVPHMVLSDYDDQMSFFQRCHNLLFSITDILIRKLYYLPIMDKMARDHFSELEGPLPSIAELEKSVSMVFVNSHFAMIKPRPMMPGMVNIAGVHIEPVKTLPKELQKFLDSAEHGVIYMSLGSFLQSSNMPMEKTKMILNVFGSLKQKVLWKFETDDLPSLPPNVMIQKWLPQYDILAHPNVLLFISHGGLFGTIESSYCGVPILFMPFFADQTRNAQVVQSRGYGQKLFFSDITEELLKSKIDEMIGNKNYRQNARQTSKLLNDNPMKPMDEAMYWIEYVIRNNGATHLKSSAVNLPWYKYLMLDIVAFSLLVLWAAWKLIRAVLSLIFSKKSQEEKKSQKKDD